MPKVKIPRKSTAIDMTAMCDVAFLLLTFFMLTTKFKPDDPAIVDTPSSISEIKLPETDILTITIDKTDKVFFGIDGQNVREETLKRIADKYKLNFTPEEFHTFSITSSFGVPVASLKQFLNLSPEDKAQLQQPGIPCDSTNNELGDWVLFARQSKQQVSAAAAGPAKSFAIAVKGDQDSKNPKIKRVIAILQEQNINKFNLITTLEAAPE